MARKGSRKVRTGCLTCKIRKIKCDEGKPFCNRCTSTGRRCDGYSTDSGATLRWQPQSSQTLQFQLDVNVPEEEARALQFFSDNVGPFISGPTDPYFWTNLIVQASNNQPAVRHSVIAISLLYEDIQTGANPHLDEVALSHYNAAIYELNDNLYQNKALVLLVCILFVCIEFLQSNKEAAIRHCNHGLAILESSCSEGCVRDHLLPIFRRLCGFPLMFGSGHQDFPDLSISRCPVPSGFANFGQAQSLIDDIFNQMVKLKRHDDMYRVGELRHEALPRELYEEKERIKVSLRQWHRLFADLDARSRSSSTRIRGAPRIYALMRYEVCKARVDMAFAPDELGYDRHVDSFRRIINEASRFAGTLGRNSHPPHFLFEAGFTPMLFFIGSQCRALDVRLEAVRLIGVLGSPREMMWERNELHAICRRIIEMEHCVTLDAYGQLALTHPDSCLGFPSDEMRVLHFIQQDSTAVHTDQNGEEFFGRNVGFFYRAPDTIYMHSEIVADALASTDRDYSSSPGGEE